MDKPLPIRVDWQRFEVYEDDEERYVGLVYDQRTDPYADLYSEAGFVPVYETPVCVTKAEVRSLVGAWLTAWDYGFVEAENCWMQTGDPLPHLTKALQGGF